MRWFTLGIGVALLFACLANAQTTKIITMRDACDPASFDAALGSGHCIPGHHGNTLFTDFIGELQTDQNAGAWRFNPMLNATAGTFKLVRLDLTSGDQTSLVNKGGETHTFTRVAKFGGGFIPTLNGLTGNPVPAPECAQKLPDGSLAPQPEGPTNQFVEAGNSEAGPTAGSYFTVWTRESSYSNMTFVSALAYLVQSHWRRRLAFKNQAAPHVFVESRR